LPAARVTAVALVAAVAAVALAGCSVTVQPKNAAAAQSLTGGTPSPSATNSAPSSAAGTTPDQSASSSSEGKDVDHTACTNVREALQTLQQKVEADKSSPRRTGQDYKTAATALRTQATKTDNSELKSALRTLANDYSVLGTDTTNHNSTTADLKKVEDASTPLDTLCGAKN